MLRHSLGESGQREFYENVSVDHPFSLLNRLEEGNRNAYYRLIGWSEITQDEYELWKLLNESK